MINEFYILDIFHSKDICVQNTYWFIAILNGQISSFLNFTVRNVRTAPDGGQFKEVFFEFRFVVGYQIQKKTGRPMSLATTQGRIQVGLKTRGPILTVAIKSNRKYI